MVVKQPSLRDNTELPSLQPRWFKPVLYLFIVVCVLVVIALLLAPMVIRPRHNRHDYVEAVRNARMLSLALLEFETEYGSFPNITTAPLVAKSHPAHGYDLTSSSSNAAFRQLFAVEMSREERDFRAKTLGSIKPDGIITPGEALKKGECGFSYISGLSSKDDPLTPLVLTPLIPGTTKFDPKPFDGKAIILHIDNSVRTYDIHKDGHVYDKGINLLSAKHPIWKGKAPDIRYPEL